MTLVDPLLLARLACPYDGGPVGVRAETLLCSVCGRTFAVVDGVPVMLRDDVRQTHDAAATDPRGDAPAPRDTPDATPPLARSGAPPVVARLPIDPFVQQAVGATCGLMYVPLVGRLTTYPIPDLRLPPGPGAGRTLLDVGCNWGRWSLAAARAGYVPIGVDPMLGAVRAASRVARQLGLSAHFVAGDARYLPLRTRTVDVAFSYSVLQHMAKHDVRRSLREMRRVLAPGGAAVVQLPNARGLRSLVVQARRRWRPAVGFEVRYWTVRELRVSFERLLGRTTVAVDGYFSINPQAVDLPLLPLRYRLIVRTSEHLRHVADRLPWLAAVADSLYVSARVG
jgi:SAM-dependent methyltransferase/uncharacterized protein YbaR (Trm112 family)